MKIFKQLNKVFESRVRLGIMSSLVVRDKMSHNELKDVLGLTDGNLASHISMLEKKGFISVEKLFVGKRPKTEYKATKKGSDAFQEHLDALEKIVKESST